MAYKDLIDMQTNWGSFLPGGKPFRYNAANPTAANIYGQEYDTSTWQPTVDQTQGETYIPTSGYENLDVTGRAQENQRKKNEEMKKLYEENQDQLGTLDQSKGIINTSNPQVNTAGFNFNNLFGMSRANAAMPTDAERMAVERSGIMQGYQPNMRNVSGEYIDTGPNLSGVNLDDTSGRHMKLKGEPFFGNYQKFPQGDQWRNKDKYLRSQDYLSTLEPSEAGAGYDRRGFNLPNFGLSGILRGLGDKFQRPEAKQKEFDLYQQSKGPGGWGDIGGGYQGNIWQGTGGNKINIADPRTGVTILRDKNFDSGFGSDSVEEMIATKEAWARKRRAKGREFLSTSMNKWLDAIDAGKGGDKPPGAGPRYGGPPTSDWNPNLARIAPTHIGAGPLHGGSGGQNQGPTGFTGAGAGSGASGPPGRNYAQGGYMRSGYNRGGRVGILSIF